MPTNNQEKGGASVADDFVHPILPCTIRTCIASVRNITHKGPPGYDSSGGVPRSLFAAMHAQSALSHSMTLSF